MLILHGRMVIDLTQPNDNLFQLAKRVLDYYFKSKDVDKGIVADIICIANELRDLERRETYYKKVLIEHPYFLQE